MKETVDQAVKSAKTKITYRVINYMFVILV